MRFASCAAPTHTLVTRLHKEKIERHIRAAIETLTLGDPLTTVDMGPVANEAQRVTVQQYIRRGVEEGSRLIAGGPGYPNGLEQGWFVRPTAFTDVSNQMAIAREEIFGPVMSVICYDTIEEAIEIANDSPYGLAAYVDGNDPREVQRVALRLRTGQVMLNGA